MKGAITNYENKFYLNQTGFSGISNVNGSYALDYKPINILGKGHVKQVLAAVPSASITIDRFLVTNDPVFGLTGDTANYLAKSISGGLYYQGKYFSFSSGYLNSFGISCSVGEVPTINSTYNIYSDIGPISNPTGNYFDNTIIVPQVKDILLTCKSSTTNRIKDFDIQFDCPKLPIYGLSSSNSQIPIEVQNTFPIEVNSTFTLEVDDYETKKAFDDLTSDGTVNFVINISGIFNFTGNNAKITSEQISSSADDVLSVKLSYKSYLS